MEYLGLAQSAWLGLSGLLLVAAPSKIQKLVTYCGSSCADLLRVAGIHRITLASLLVTGEISTSPRLRRNITKIAFVYSTVVALYTSYMYNSTYHSSEWRPQLIFDIALHFALALGYGYCLVRGKRGDGKLRV